MKTLCVIPARLQSTRLPNKMLADVQGQPMIQMTYMGAKKCTGIDHFIVATDSNEIKAIVEAVGGDVIMTDPSIQTGSDRVATVAKHFPEYDVIINLQGDEPFIQAPMLTELISPYSSGENPPMATLAYELFFPEEYENPNIVKVILDQHNYAIYFSRAPIPYPRQRNQKLPVLHHMGLYAYRRDFLLEYTQLPQTPLEKTELLEQLRALEHGYNIKVTETTHRTFEINTPEELAMAQTFAMVA
jgi:3-deoxy-manno-octulosonate cytidylyltransferase (CMP-KDO synthetase)